MCLPPPAQNIISITNELERPTRARTTSLIVTAEGSALLLYVIVALCGYASCNSHVAAPPLCHRRPLWVCAVTALTLAHATLAHATLAHATLARARAMLARDTLGRGTWHAVRGARYVTRASG